MREDWIECKAEDFGELIRGITYNKNQASDIPTDNYLPLLRANNINDNKLNFDDIKYVEESLIDDFQKIIPNDILIAMSSGSKHLVGKSAQSKGHYEGSFGAFCAVFSPIKTSRVITFHISFNQMIFERISVRFPKVQISII